MKQTFDIAGQVLVTMRGFGLASCKEAGSSEPIDAGILRPEALRGQVPKIDPATGMAASAAVRLRRQSARGATGERIGIVLATQYGNRHMASQFAAKVRKGQSSPSLYATSGYNICAGLSALAAGINGPTLVLAGKSMGLADALMTAALYIQRGDADVMYAGQTETNAGGSEGICTMFAVSKTDAFAEGGSQWQYEIVPQAALDENRHQAEERLAASMLANWNPVQGTELAHMYEGIALYAALSGEVPSEQLQGAAAREEKMGEVWRLVFMGSLGQRVLIGRKGEQ
jgi:hypothetical protein